MPTPTWECSSQLSFHFVPAFETGIRFSNAKIAIAGHFPISFKVMSFATAKLSELPLRGHSSFFTQPFCSSLRTNKYVRTQNPKSRNSNSPNSTWLSKWPPKGNSVRGSPKKEVSRNVNEEKARYLAREKGETAIERIVLRLRNLGLGPDDEEGGGEEGREETRILTAELPPVNGEERLADLLKREWIRPDTVLDEDDDSDDEMALPWEREEKEKEMQGREEDGGRERKRRPKAPTLAELTIDDEELRRLRRMGMTLRERINVPKAGITQEVLEKIHDKWRKAELVRLKFHEFLAHDMKTGHEIVERRTGGLVLWRAGSVMIVYRGANYQGPKSTSELARKEEESRFIPDVSSADSFKSDEAALPDPEKSILPVEIEYNKLLDGLGARYEAWWGTGVLPVDADLLPPKVPGYMTPFRCLPTGMRPRLTNVEMTNLRKLAKSLPCHFALGRNRNHQGLAVAILKLWEQSLIVKIAVKRGIQNTNNKLMAEEINQLTGGVLLLRNKYYIVIFRGKDFLPANVASQLAERQEMTKQIQDNEEKLRSNLEASPSGKEGEGNALAGTLAEFYEAQARWGRDTSVEEHEKMVEEAAKAKTARLVRRIEHKLANANSKKLRAEKLLSKIEASMVPADPDYDRETITDEERIVFRKIGLRMKPYLPMGIRGVFDGVIENMHLHWKYREVVKLITKQKTMTFVEDTARLLEYESGGILVAIERVPKGYALIYYRGKNYHRPISLRPRNLLTKAKALKRFVAMQRHEALSQHIFELEHTIKQLKAEIGLSEDESSDNWSTGASLLVDSNSDFTEVEDEASYIASDEDVSNDDGEEEDLDWEDEDFESSDSENSDDILAHDI
ncbi:unnamed protein product [Linum tenue]|uniref:CRM domain-containing protein n=2 Tax=Linum tenue TaxID=586396 RepID=A0AAV0ITX4_9ROSI|nr:unnamed protein product [Linum tenue]